MNVTRSGALGAARVSLPEIASLRDAYRAEQNRQIVHDAIHRRHGWTHEYALVEGGETVGYASLAVDGPWRDRPTFYESYVVPAHRHRAFALFETFLEATKPLAFEVQSDDVLTTSLALAYAESIGSERIVFRDASDTGLAIAGAELRPLTSDDELRAAMAARQGGGEWQLEVDGQRVGGGGLLFHYNPPHADLYMEVDEPHRRRGYGALIVQELKRACYALGAIPGARCSTSNHVSARTLQRAGMLPSAHILFGALRPAT